MFGMITSSRAFTKNVRIDYCSFLVGRSDAFPDYHLIMAKHVPRRDGRHPPSQRVDHYRLSRLALGGCTCNRHAQEWPARRPLTNPIQHSLRLFLPGEGVARLTVGETS